MMKAVLERAGSMKGVRLIQEAFNSASLSLYASLGFEVKEPVSVMGGSVKDARKPDGFRLMTNSDLDRCAKLCMKVHGIHRSNELADAVRMFEPVVLERGGRIVAYASAPKAWLISHSMGETQADFEALIEGLCAMRGEVLLFVPTRQAAMFRWCLSRGLRVLKPATLMSMGEYQEPRGTWTPSVLY